jgi:hypothetical protein
VTFGRTVLESLFFRRILGTVTVERILMDMSQVREYKLYIISYGDCGEDPHGHATGQRVQTVHNFIRTSTANEDFTNLDILLKKNSQ